LKEIFEIFRTPHRKISNLFTSNHTRSSTLSIGSPFYLPPIFPIQNIFSTE